MPGDAKHFCQWYNSSKNKQCCNLLLLLSGNVEINPGPTLLDKIPKCPGNSLSFFSANVNSLRGKIDSVHSYCETYKPGVFALQETKLSNHISTSPELSIPNYQLFCTDRNQNGGGVALYVHNTLDPRIQNKAQIPNGLEIIAVDFLHGCDRRFAVSVYKSPSQPVVEFIELFTDFLGQFGEHTNNLIIGGDFNIDALSAAEFHLLQDICDTYAFQQLIDEPTHRQRAIDHLYIGTNFTVNFWGLSSPIEKCHAMLIMYLPMQQNAPKQNPQKRQVLCYKCADWNQLKQLIIDADLRGKIQNAVSVNKAWLLWRT